MIPLAAGLGLRGTMGLPEWGLVALASVIILGIIGPKLARDIKGWFATEE